MVKSPGATRGTPSSLSMKPVCCLGSGLPPTGAKTPIGDTELIFEKSTGSLLNSEPSEHLVVDAEGVVTGVDLLIGVGLAAGDAIVEGAVDVVGSLFLFGAIDFQISFFPMRVQMKLSPPCVRFAPIFLHEPGAAEAY